MFSRTQEIMVIRSYNHARDVVHHSRDIPVSTNNYSSSITTLLVFW